MRFSNAAEFHAAIADLGAQPHGRARCAQAEEIVAGAEELGELRLLVMALQHLIYAYEYGAGAARMPVPFARLLRLLDTHPESFSPRQLKDTRWYFKWVTAALIKIPETTLSAITAWIREMEHRYQAAGFSMRTVAAQELILAIDLGDLPRVEQLRATMLSLPRDEMSDCAACEARLLGRAHAALGRDREAVGTWSDVLSGKLTCLEEPHATLAWSLLPLLRLGQPDQAKVNHLRGYHLARGNANLATAIGRHAEFCALTGNEGRGLEILAENWHLLTAVTDAMPRLEFLTGVAVLLRRLNTVGSGDLPVHSGTADRLLRQITPEITDLADRFDARNGTPWVGDTVRRRLNEPPLLNEQLLLTTAPVALSRVPAPLRSGAAEMPDDLASLVARARDLDTSGHPGADEAWDKVAALTAEADLDPLLAAELAQHRGFANARSGNWADAAASMSKASGHFEAAGEPGRAAAATARALWAAAQPEPDPDTWAGLDAQFSRVRDLLEAGEAKPRDLLTVLHARALVAATALERGGGDNREAFTERLAAEVNTLIAGARQHQAPAREAVGEAMLAHVSRMAGDLDGEGIHLTEAIRLFEDAQRPWATAQIRARLGEIELARANPAAAAPLLENAIAIATQWPADGFPHGIAHMMLAHAYQMQGQPELALPNARTGLARFTRAGDTLAAAQARAELGRTLAAADRLGEAITMLTDAVHELSEQAAGDAAAQPRITLGQVLRQSGDHRGAARQFALAAEAFSAGHHQQAHLFASGEAALALAQAEMWQEARQAYAHSIELATTLGQWQHVVKMQRELAQLAVRDGGDDGVGRALSHIEQALAAGQHAYTGVSGKPAGDRVAGRPAGSDNRDLVRERGITRYEAGRALAHAERFDDAIGWLLLGITDLESDDASIGELAQATYLAATIESSRLGRAEDARQRLQAVAERCTKLGHEDAAAELRRLSTQAG